jgi:YidC/Oxa1 family membrane protein insertase
MRWRCGPVDAAELRAGHPLRQADACQSIYVLHEGLIGVTGEEGLQEIEYSDAGGRQARSPPASRLTAGWASPTSTGRWRWCPRARSRSSPSYSWFDDGPPALSGRLRDRRESRWRPGGSSSVETLVFAGAKEVGTIQAYESRAADSPVRPADRLGLVLFHHQADVLSDRHALSRASAISASPSWPRPLSSRPFFFPLANKSYASMANMKKSCSRRCSKSARNTRTTR